MLAASQPPPVQDPEQVREVADEVLSRSEFGDPPVTLLERLAQWIADLFGSPSPNSPGTAPTPGSGGSGFLTVLLLVGVVVVLVLVVRALLRQPRLSRTDADPDPTVEVEEHLSTAAWERVARDHEAAGRYKEGMRCRFRALVGQLVDGDVLDDVPGRTTRELHDELTRVAPGTGPDFGAAGDLFDAAWYGDVATGPDEARRFDLHARAVLEQAARVAQPEPVLVGAVPVGDEGP